MSSIKLKARQAKQRLKSNYWENCKQKIKQEQSQARTLGINEQKVGAYMRDKVKDDINGQKEDAFYAKVKQLLDTEGEVSNALGRLTDQEVYQTLSYEEKQRYNLRLSAAYIAALEKYRREKGILN